MQFHTELPVYPRRVNPPRSPRSTGAYDCEVPLPILPTSSSVVLVPVVEQAVGHTYDSRTYSINSRTQKHIARYSKLRYNTTNIVRELKHST